MEEILNKAIEEFVANTGGNTPSVIIINPVAWDDLVDEFLLSKGVKVTPLKMKCRFSVREFPVYRSEDLSIDDPIKVY